MRAVEVEVRIVEVLMLGLMLVVIMRLMMIYMHRQMLVLELKSVQKETWKILPSMKSFIRLRLVRVIRIARKIF